MQSKTINEILSESFDITKDNFFSLMVNSLIYNLLVFFTVISVVGMLLIPNIYTGFCISCLNLKRHKQMKIGQFLSDGFTDKRWLNFFLLQIAIVLVGFIVGGSVLGLLHLLFGVFYSNEMLLATSVFLIFIYITTVTALSLFFLTDKNLTVFNSILESRKLAHKFGFLKLAFFIIFLSAIQLLLSFVPLVGAILSIFLFPLIILSYTIIYDNYVS